MAQVSLGECDSEDFCLKSTFASVLLTTLASFTAVAYNSDTLVKTQRLPNILDGIKADVIGLPGTCYWDDAATKEHCEQFHCKVIKCMIGAIAQALM